MIIGLAVLLLRLSSKKQPVLMNASYSIDHEVVTTKLQFTRVLCSLSFSVTCGTFKTKLFSDEMV